jgi:hypothetical protein
MPMCKIFHLCVNYSMAGDKVGRGVWMQAESVLEYWVNLEAVEMLLSGNEL